MGEKRNLLINNLEITVNDTLLLLINRFLFSPIINHLIFSENIVKTIAFYYINICETYRQRLYQKKRTVPEKDYKCEGRDLNPRIPSEITPEAIAFDRSGQPSQFAFYDSSFRSNAFWTCSLFSAWSNTAEFGPSTTSAVISSPLWAGRQ